MKLATLRDGSRDGQLIVVSRDLSLAHYATGIATRMQQVLDDWNFLSPQLNDLSVTLNHGKARHAFAFDPRQCLAPLPRACGWWVPQAADGDANRSDMPTLLAAPGDSLLGAGDDAWPQCIPDAAGAAVSEVDAQAPGLDAAAMLGVVTGDIEAGTPAARALEGVRLLLLMVQWRWRMPGADIVPVPLGATCAPVTVTPDELGDAWTGGLAGLPVQLGANGRRIGLCDGAQDQRWPFGVLLARAAAWRGLNAGSVVAGGELLCADGSRGHGSLHQRRRHEAAEIGAPRTPLLRAGDSVRADVRGRDGTSVFGAIDLRLGPPPAGAAAEAADALANDAPPAGATA
jgi:fumarylacetoacetate (FAA) hydrolase